jgi:F-type H+-transporting ATPase subunit b
MEINASLIAQIITFFALIAFAMKFVWPPLVEMLDERAAKIADGLAAADKAKQDLNLAEQRVTEALREAKVQATEIIAQADKRAAQLLEEAKVSAGAEGARLISGAKAEVEQEIYRAKEALRQQVAQLVVTGAEKILRKEINASVHADLLNTLKAEL